jgi:hypothetical protein
VPGARGDDEDDIPGATREVTAVSEVRLRENKVQCALIERSDWVIDDRTET